jgi:hypothetical protein
MKLLEETKKFVDSKFRPDQLPHFDRTLYWVKKLKPDADEALQIAAYSHDILRGFGIAYFQLKHLGIQGFYEHHQKEGAKIMIKFLKTKTDDKKLIKRVGYLVGNHEFGGDDAANLLKDADSISFFEKNAERFISKIDDYGYDFMKDKFNFMFNRITSEKAKKIARPMYEDAMSKLEKLN